MYKILSAVSRMIAPIMSFTAEEIWRFMPHSSDDDIESIMLNQMPEKTNISVNDKFIEKWNFIYQLR